MGRATRDLISVAPEAGVIVDVEATPAHRRMEVESTKTMVERVEQRFGLKPDRLVGDTAYGTAPMLAWMVNDKGIAPHMPVWDRSDRKDGTLSSSEFDWDEHAKQYRCPQGHALLSERGRSPGPAIMSPRPRWSSTVPARTTALDAR